MDIKTFLFVDEKNNIVVDNLTIVNFLRLRDIFFSKKCLCVLDKGVLTPHSFSKFIKSEHLKIPNEYQSKIIDFQVTGNIGEYELNYRLYLDDDRVLAWNLGWDNKNVNYNLEKCNNRTDGYRKYWLDNDLIQIKNNKIINWEYFENSNYWFSGEKLTKKIITQDCEIIHHFAQGDSYYNGNIFRTSFLFVVLSDGCLYKLFHGMMKKIDSEDQDFGILGQYNSKISKFAKSNNSSYFAVELINGDILFFMKKIIDNVKILKYS